MSVSVRSSSSSHRFAELRAVPLAGLSLLLAVVAALTGPSMSATAAVASVATVASLPATAAPAATATVGSLGMTGSTISVTVNRIYRKGQVQWVNHVLDSRLTDLDGCQAERSRATWDGRVYRSTVRLVCVDGPARAEAAARALVDDRPWYRVRTARVALVGFGLVVDRPEGNDRAVPAALAQLPNGPFTFADGDDLSLNYVGQGVTQGRLDAAVAAFAAALGVPVSAVEISPLTGN